MKMDFSKLLTQIDSVTTKKASYEDKDTDFWRATKDKAGNASAVLRFLPDADINEVPFERRFSYAFKNEATNKWYIENSPSTIGLPDPVSDYNRELWETGLEANKDDVRKRKRKESYIVNILVLKDSGNPDNEGKVFKFAMGKKMFAKIVEVAKPDPELGEEAINAFDPMEGADFIFKQKVQSGFPNYDDSKFGSKKALFGGDKKKIAAVLAQCFDLSEEVAPSKFKSYEELDRKFKTVMGLGSKAPQKSYDAEMDELAKIASEADEQPKTVPAKKATKATVPTPALPEEDDDFFAKLLED
jgi:hypothetical protein